MKKICCALALIVTLCAGHTAGAITATLYKETDYGRIIPETRITTAGTNKTESVFSNRGAFIIAKAVKLGRGNAYSVAADTTVDTGKTEIAKPQCDDSCTTCDTTTGKCVGCPSGKRPNGNRCVDNCYNVVCKSGYTTVNTADGCCCEAESACGAGQVYNTTIGKCVDAVCPVGCLDDCSKGCGSCESGRYLNYSNGYCPTCSSAIANCATCDSSPSGPTCTSCDSGYNLENGQCVKAECGSGQLKIGGQCVECINGASITCGSGAYSSYYRISNGTCCKLPAGCTAATNFDLSCTGCSGGYMLKNGQCAVCPAGTYSVAGATSCTTCPTGYTSNAGATSCTICADGYKSAGSYGCVTCPAGYYYSIKVNGDSGGCRKTGSLAFGALTNDSAQCRSGWAVPGGNDGIQGSHCGQGSVIGPF